MDRLSRITPAGLQTQPSRLQRAIHRVGSVARNLTYKLLSTALDDPLISGGYYFGMNGAGLGSYLPPLSPEQVKRVDLLDKFMGLVMQCFKRANFGSNLLFIWDVLGELGKDPGVQVKNGIIEQKERESHNDYIPAPEPPGSMPDIDKLDKIVNIPLKDRAMITEEVGKLAEEERKYILHPYSEAFIMHHWHFIHSRDKGLREWIDNARANIAAYYIYQNRIAELMDSSSFDPPPMEAPYERGRVLLGVEVAKVLIALGRKETAAAFLINLLDRAASAENCIFLRLGDNRTFNILLKVLPLIRELVPECFTEETLIWIVRRYLEAREKESIEKRELLVNAGALFPKKIVEKVAALADTRTAAILREGIVLFETPREMRPAILPRFDQAITIRDVAPTNHLQVEIEIGITGLPIDREHYDELRNVAILQHGDIIPGHNFILGKPESYRNGKRALLTINTQPTSKLLPLMQQAAELASPHNRNLMDLAYEIADMVHRNYSRGQGKEERGVQLTLGGPIITGGCCRHRSATLQMAYQAAGIPSRYVRGFFMLQEEGWHAWVEVAPESPFAFIIDLNIDPRELGIGPMHEEFNRGMIIPSKYKIEKYSNYAAYEVNGLHYTRESDGAVVWRPKY
jgi:hypothetical protein